MNVNSTSLGSIIKHTATNYWQLFPQLCEASYSFIQNCPRKTRFIPCALHLESITQHCVSTCWMEIVSLYMHFQSNLFLRFLDLLLYQITHANKAEGPRPGNKDKWMFFPGWRSYLTLLWITVTKYCEFESRNTVFCGSMESTEVVMCEGMLCPLTGWLQQIWPNHFNPANRL